MIPADLTRTLLIVSENCLNDYVSGKIIFFLEGGRAPQVPSPHQTPMMACSNSISNFNH